jgi:hypothetical protein
MMACQYPSLNRTEKQNIKAMVRQDAVEIKNLCALDELEDYESNLNGVLERIDEIVDSYE